MRQYLKEKLEALAVGLSLLTSAAGYMTETSAQTLSFINISDALKQNGFDPEDDTFGIECGEPDFVYVTVFEQGLLAKINKDTRSIDQIIDDPDSQIVPHRQNFFSVARDPNSGNLFIGEFGNGKLWRFDPSVSLDTAWTRIPLIPQVTDRTPEDGVPIVVYPRGYDVDPANVSFDIDGDGIIDFQFSHRIFSGVHGIVFADGNMWVALDFTGDFAQEVNDAGVPDLRFRGLAKVDPTTLEVSLVSLEEFGAIFVRQLVVDSVEPNFVWITDFFGGQVFKFDTTPQIESVVQTIPLETESFLQDESFPFGIATDGINIYVALQQELGVGPDNSTIAQIDKANQSITLIDTGAPKIITLPNGQIDDGTGTFTVFVNGGLLVWTDGSQHVGTIDLDTGEKSFEITETINNHFGCVPIDGEFWFAGKGSVKVGILPNSKFIGGRPTPTSKFSGGRPVRVTADSRYYEFGDPTDPRYDSNGPVIEEVLIQESSIKILAEITDTVGVKDAYITIGKKAFPMSRYAGSQSWWYRVFTVDDLPASGDTISAKIVASDFNNNKAEHSFTFNEPTGALSATTEGLSFIIVPLLAVGEQTDQGYSITANGARQDSQNISPRITIKNTGIEPMKNIRVMLSPELKGKFLLSDYAIKSIASQSEYTVFLKLNGKPNVDATNNPIPYKGQIIVSIDNRSPYILEISGQIPNESASLQSIFMQMVANKAEQRYKSFEKPDLRISQNAEYEVRLGSGASIMNKASDELIISNKGDNPLRNLRIMTSLGGDHFLPDQKNIDLLPAGSFVKVKLVSKLNIAETRNLSGEIIIVPENGLPVTVPVEIIGSSDIDKNAMYQVSTVSGNEEISNTVDGIKIKNNSEESIENVRIILPRQLARVFSLSEDSFKSIEPNNEEIVYIRQRGTFESNLRQILNDYDGEIIIVSSNGMKKVLPVDIVWKGIASEHFVINARNSAEELTKAVQVINFLEHNYGKTADIIGETNTKTVIYLTSSLDEVKMLSNALAPSAYVYSEDMALIWSNSEDINILALKQFAHRTIMQNHGTYWAKQKIVADKGNWLVEGISNYATARIVGERGTIKEQLDAFIKRPVSFEWYGTSTPSHYGASYTLFKFLADRYGETVIDRTLSNLDSTMVSNYKCTTFEQCVLLGAVYDVNGFNMNDKRYELNFATIMKEWKDYVKENYGIYGEELRIENRS